MKNSRAVVAMIGIALVIAFGAMAGRTANAATSTVLLGTAANFSVLAGTAVTNTLATTINRNVGVDPGSSITGFPPGIIGGTTHAADAVALQAQSDRTIAYNVAAARTPTTVVAGGLLGGLTLVDGVYNSGSFILDLTGTVTLNGQGDPNSVWIFQATSSLITASSGARVSLINGASPCNVFWQVTSSANLGSGTSFVGTILADTSITLQSGVTVDGRALAGTGNVTLINDTFISSACQTGPIPPTRPPFTIAPTATPTPAPTAAAVATATPTIVPTATPGAAPTAASTVAGVQSLPSTSTDASLSPLVMLAIAMAGLGLLLLLRRPIRNS
jgi:LPXTG-motif cell wall-anchored protein